MIEPIFFALLSNILLASLAYIAFIITRNTSIIDLFWPVFILAASLLFCSFQSEYALLILSCIGLWALRLFFFLAFTRFRFNHKDRRYNVLLSRTEHWFSIFCHYLLQSILATAISLPLLFIRSSIGYMGIALSILAVLAIILESISDGILYFHKKKFSGTICEQSLWRLSRHPNLFFDWLFWLIIAIAAVFFPQGYLGLLSPVLLFIIMRYITIPLTEKCSLDRHADFYRVYQRNTLIFFFIIKNIFSLRKGG